MTAISHIVSAEPVVHGVLKIGWNDGYEGIVDLRGVIADGPIFEYVRNPENFRQVHIAEYGHSLGWTDTAGNEIDFGADRLREIAEEQAALLARAG